MDIIPAKVVNGSIQVLNDFITQGRQKTTLNANVAAAAGTITVFSITGFTAGNFYVLIGDIGNGNAEIVKMHASTAPTGQTITLAANTVYAHDAGESVYYINFNQVEFSRAATTTGTKTVLATQAIDPRAKWSLYSDVTNSTGYGFARFKNEGGSTFSAYSAAAPYANADSDTVEYLINQAFIETGAKPSESLTYDYLINQINECLRDIKKAKNKMSWSQEYNYTLGAYTQGKFSWSLPDNIYDKYSFKAVEGVRLGREKGLIKVGPDHFFNSIMEDVAWTTVRTTASAGDTTLEVDNSYDFDDTGTVWINGSEVTYTGVTRSTTAGVLTGVPASGTGAIPAAGFAAGDYVFQGQTEGEPLYWTMFNGALYTYPVSSTTYEDRNLFLDYYRAVTAVDSLDDTVDYIQFDLIKNWLKWKIRAITKNSGVEDLKDPSFAQYREGLLVLVRKDKDTNKRYFRNAYDFPQTDEDGDNPRKLNIN